MNPTGASGAIGQAVCIGPVCVDHISGIPGGPKQSLGGAVYFGALTLAELGWNVTVISPHPGREWATALAQTTAAQRRPIRWLLPELGAATRFENHYATRPDGHLTRAQRVAAKGAAITPEVLDGCGPGAQEALAAADAVYLGPLLPHDVPLATVERLAALPAHLACAAQGYVRRLADGTVRPGAWDRRDEFLPLLRWIALDTDELLAAAPEQGSLAARMKSLPLAAQAELLVTKGEDGAYMMDGLTRKYWEAKARRSPAITDTTGAGDTFLACYINFRHLGLGARDALEASCQATSKLLERRPPRP